MLFPKSVSYSCYHFPMDYNTLSVVEPLSKTEFEGHIAKQASNISEQRFSTWFPSPKTLQKAKYRCPLGNRSNSTKMQEPLNQLPDLVWYFSVFLTYFFPLKKKTTSLPTDPGTKHGGRFSGVSPGVLTANPWPPGWRGCFRTSMLLHKSWRAWSVGKLRHLMDLFWIDDFWSQKSNREFFTTWDP